MSPALRPVGHEDRLSIVEHLDELRTRLFASIAVFIVAFAFCMWQNDTLLDIVNEPLQRTTESAGDESSAGRLEGIRRNQAELKSALLGIAAALEASSADPEAGGEATRDAAAAAAEQAREVAAALPTEAPDRKPVTLGVGEPFTTTLTVAAWGALLLSLPFLLYQAYSFVLPAFTPGERRAVLPLLLMVPFLFLAGVAFAYFLVLPSAVEFLQNFNDEQFDILVQAKDYYRFSVLVLISMGLLFQMPVGVLAATRVGVITPAALRKNRRYAIVGIAVVAMLLPGTDPITMLIAMGPLVLLFELSILLASLVDRRREADDEESAADSTAVDTSNADNES